MRLALLLLAVTLCGCQADNAAPVNRSATPPFVQTGDLDEIHRMGTLRVLVAETSDRSLPRNESPLEYERELIRAYARQEGLDIFWISVDSRNDLIPRLLKGDGDLIAANLTVTDERRDHVAFTYPVSTVRELIVTRDSDESLTQAADLEGRQVAVRRSSSFYRSLIELRKTYPGIDIKEVPEHIDTDELVHRVATRRLDVTAADSNLLAEIMSYRDDVREAFELSGDRPIAWAIRPETEELRRSLNGFLSQTELARRAEEIRTDDLPGIRDKTLRLLTRNSAATYFLWRGRLKGFEYELAREFAEQHGLRLKVIVPPRSEDLLPWLIEGRGDLVAAALTPTEDRGRPRVAFSEPYNFVSQMVVTRSDDDSLLGPRDLGDRTIYVRHSSAYWRTLSRLRASGIPLILQAAPERLESEEIIDLVAEDVYDLTVAASHVLDIELMFRDDVQPAFALGDPVPLAWAMRANNPELQAAVNGFLRREYRGVTYNVLYQRYFRDRPRIERHIEYRTSNGDLSPYDDIVKKWASRYDFDWRMIVSMIRQESQFDPEARSFAGAVGLMQLLPRTALDLGVTDLKDPETNIRAGLKYLAWLRDRFDEDLPVRDRMWFILASYNVGYGHVVDARRIAAQEGLNPDRWFDHVEKAMLLLARPEYASRSRHGYCRGSEPVKYVREISGRYHAYIDALERQTAGI